MAEGVVEVEVDGLIQGAERMDTDPPSNLKASRMSGSRLEATKGHLQPYGSLLLSLMRKSNEYHWQLAGGRCYFPIQSVSSR